jgi:hypothetical protein
MKTLKLNEKTSKIDREAIAKIGKAIYQFQDIEFVFIKVKFKDGSSIGFKREELDDEVENMMRDNEK